MRIGIISDTHIPMNADGLPHQLEKVFAGVALILHAGDIYLPSVLDELEEWAPVFAAYGDGDARLGIKKNADPRMKEHQVIGADGKHIGLTHSLRLHGPPLEKVFGHQVDIAVSGHSHEAGITTHNGTLLINPGSATLPHHQLNHPGTVALLDIVDGKVEARIIQLE